MLNCRLCKTSLLYIVNSHQYLSQLRYFRKFILTNFCSLRFQSVLLLDDVFKYRIQLGGIIIKFHYLSGLLLYVLSIGFLHVLEILLHLLVSLVQLAIFLYQYFISINDVCNFWKFFTVLFLYPIEKFLVLFNCLFFGVDSRRFLIELTSKF